MSATIGEVVLSNSERNIIIRFELGLSGFVHISDLHALPSKNLKTITVRSTSFLGVDASDILDAEQKTNDRNTQGRKDKNVQPDRS